MGRKYLVKYCVHHIPVISFLKDLHPPFSTGTILVNQHPIGVICNLLQATLLIKKTKTKQTQWQLSLIIKPMVSHKPVLTLYFTVHSTIFCFEIYFSHTGKKNNKIITLTLTQIDTH